MYRVPIRTPELNLKCLITSNPLAKVKWMFLPQNLSKYDLEHRQKLDLDHNWIDLSLHAGYSVESYARYKDSENIQSNISNLLYKLPLSKYFVREKNFELQFIDSILSIKVIIFRKYYSRRSRVHISNQFRRN